MAVVYTDAGESYTTGRHVGDPAAAAAWTGIGTGSAAGGSFTKSTTSLPTEVESRAAATITQQTTGSTNDTVRYVGTQTATAGRAVTCAGVFDASTSGNLTIASDGLSVTLASGDSIQNTFNLQFA
jgi:hypothetical protein